MNAKETNKFEYASTPWVQIVVFAIIATLLSWPFRSSYLDFGDWLIFGVPVLQVLLEGSGVFVATLILTRGFRKFWNPVTFLGGFPLHSLVVWATPPVVLALVGVGNSLGENPHVFGLMLGTTLSIYGLLEEMGWRGFLQNAMLEVPDWKRYLVVGVIWYLWHLSFLMGPWNLVSQAIFFLVCIAGSYLLGSLVAKTNAVLLVASFHSIINMVWLNKIGGISWSTNDLALLVGLIVLVWVPVLIHWNRRKKLLVSSPIEV